jgi:hypothetical protein
MIKLLASVLLVVCAACGGGKGGGGVGNSGVDPDATLPSLDAGEVRDVCEYLVELLGPVRTVDCGDGTMEVGTDDPASEIEDCVDGFMMTQQEFANCTATVGEIEQCFEDTFSDAGLCSEGMPASCAPIFNDPDCSNI